MTKNENPVLTAFREYTAAYKEPYAVSDEAALWLADIEEMDGPGAHATLEVGVTPEHIDVAGKVLTRLAALHA